jgi:hypothetical protein
VKSKNKKGKGFSLGVLFWFFQFIPKQIKSQEQNPSMNGLPVEWQNINREKVINTSPK